MSAREFDLNIEKVLENWTVPHALREIIANALDEKVLSNTKSIDIYKDSTGCWHIRDYGRGLRYIHFTQNENAEKLEHPSLIGKFGVGLKDALATFDRNNVQVTIDSKYGHYTIGKSKKHGFSDLLTLHTYVEDPIDPSFCGTDFCLYGCSDKDIFSAKLYFLEFANITLLEKTQYGDIYASRDKTPEIFINGVKVAEEENFLFSYNITSLNKKLKDALNRERTNVGRSAYSDRVRSILLSAESEAVISAFVDNLSQMSDGTQCDEMKWVDVQTHAVKLLNNRKDTIFLTPQELERSSGSVQEIINNSGKKPIFIPETVKNKIENETDATGKKISTISTVLEEYNNSFEYHFIDIDELTAEEKKIYKYVPEVLRLLGSKMKPDQIYISNVLKSDGSDNTLGLYEKENDRIIILRKQLNTLDAFLGTLIHELIHADTGFGDVSRFFEHELTVKIGLLAKLYFEEKEKKVQVSSETNNFRVLSNFMRPILRKLTTEELLEYENHLNDDDTEGALELYSELINRNPNEIRYYKERMWAYFNSDDYPNALLDINACIDIDKGAAESYVYKALILHRLSNESDAQKYLLKALSMDDDNQTILFYGAMIKAELGNYEEALNYIEKVKSKNNRSWIMHCTLLTILYRHNEAIEKCTEALKQYPNEAGLYHIKALSLHQTSRSAEAVKYSDEAVRLAPNVVKYNILNAAIKIQTNSGQISIPL